MARQPRLRLRGDAWTFRVRVPDRLRPIIGKREIWKSLGTVPREQAERLARAESVRVDALFAQAERELETASKRSLASITDAELSEIARSYFVSLERAAPPVPFDMAERAERKASAEGDALTFGQSLEDPVLQATALDVGRSFRHGFERDNPDFFKLVEAIQRALVEHYRRETDRAELAPEGSYDPLFSGLSKASPQTLPSLTLAEAIRQFKASPERQHVSVKTRAAYEFRYAVLADILGGDRPVADITRADIRGVRDTLLKLPPNATKRFVDVPLQRVAELAAQQGLTSMSPKSAKLYLHAANALFRWLVREELATTNPASGIGGLPISRAIKRRGFTVPELNTLFTSSTFGGAEGKGWLYWLPRVALFTGARFAEILALKANDVFEVEGVPVISIAPNEERALKTIKSRRLVPLHPTLVSLGFIAHSQRLGGGGPLFPDATGPEHMVRARNQEMGRKLRAVLPDTALVFHSFRHTFKEAAGRARIPREHIASIGGWELDGGRAAMDDYGRDPLVVVLAHEISKIRYAGLNL